MSKFTFISEDTPSPFGDEILTKRTFQFEASHLDGIIGEFENFLRGSGFYFDGHLELVNSTTNTQSPFEEDDLDDLDSIFSGRKSVIRSDEC